MDIISSKNVISIVRKTLNYIDERLINHGERVSYILYKMLVYDNKLSRKDIISYTVAGLLHDIGAYKSEELNEMIQFETQNVWGHSVYGYLFLRYLSPLNKLSEIVLYHHLDYEKLQKLNSKYEDIAGYLNLADRIDICLMTNDRREFKKIFEDNSNVKFSINALRLFREADREFSIVAHINDKSYLLELNNVFGEIVLNKAQKEMFLKMLIYSIDFRSEYTVMHTITTVSVADEIGRLMKLSPHEKESLHYGALLHDIGKITTPINILEAPRKLTNEEMKVMRNHVKMSELILKDYIDEEILEIAIRHHEKLDGTGYHRGLKADELTLPQRILAVSDIISALCGKRSYKDSFDKAKIFHLIAKDAIKGKLCPDTVLCVMDHFDEIKDNVHKETYKPLHIYSEIKTKYGIFYDKLQKL